MADLPVELPEPLRLQLRAAADIEGKIPRALEALGPLAGRDVAILDLPPGPLRDRLEIAGIHARQLPLSEPLVIEAPDSSLDAVVSLWSGFRGVDPSAVREVDRVLRPGGRLLVVHDYGRDDVSELREPGAPEYAVWSRRDGPFLCGGGFRIRVLHCFWTFPSLDEAREFLIAGFDARGGRVAERLKRPRVTWNVAVYHRTRGGPSAAAAPAAASPDAAVSANGGEGQGQ